jgi:drug/metabolite transporter (DMT)-like permease
VTTIAIVLWAANLLCDTVGQLAFKSASIRVARFEGLAWWLKLLRTPHLWLGVGAFVVEPLMWLGFLSLVPLAQAVMLGSANIVGVMIGGRLLFGERLSGQRLAAIGLICLGVILVGGAA